MIHTPPALRGHRSPAIASQSGCTDGGALSNLRATGTNVVRFPDGTTATIVCHGNAISLRGGGQMPSSNADVPLYKLFPKKHYYGARNDHGF
jgi:hypothetical protein